MATKNKNNKPEKMNYQARQQRWLRVTFIVVSVILILSWVLSLITNV